MVGVATRVSTVFCCFVSAAIPPTRARILPDFVSQPHRPLFVDTTWCCEARSAYYINIVEKRVGGNSDGYLRVLRVSTAEGIKVVFQKVYNFRIHGVFN